MAQQGTVEWAQQTRGNLTRREQVRMVGVVLARVAPLAAERITTALGRRPSGALDRRVAALMTPPDGAWAEEATRVAAAQTPAVLGHAVRTWCYAVLLADVDGTTTDREVLYAASLLHDLTLPDAPAETCFTITSGAAVRAAAEAVGVGAERAAEAEAAVIGHVSPDVREAVHGPHAVYVQQGAMLDLAGQRRSALSAEAIAEVVAANPVGDTHREMAANIRRAAASAPATRMGVLRRCALPAMILTAPAEVRGG